MCQLMLLVQAMQAMPPECRLVTQLPLAYGGACWPTAGFTAPARPPQLQCFLPVGSWVGSGLVLQFSQVQPTRQHSNTSIAGVWQHSECGSMNTGSDTHCCICMTFHLRLRLNFGSAQSAQLQRWSHSRAFCHYSTKYRCSTYLDTTAVCHPSTLSYAALQLRVPMQFNPDNSASNMKARSLIGKSHVKASMPGSVCKQCSQLTELLLAGCTSFLPLK